MRTLLIELLLEAIEGLLLTKRVALGRLQRGLLQCRVHALMRGHYPAAKPETAERSGTMPSFTHRIDTR